jgi:hypothetical protein
VKARLSVLVSRSEAAEISRLAGDAGLSVSAYLYSRALGIGLGDAEAIMVFDKILDELTERVDEENAGIIASLERIDTAHAARS